MYSLRCQSAPLASSMEEDQGGHDWHSIPVSVDTNSFGDGDSKIL
jgi:hypothetical protein